MSQFKQLHNLPFLDLENELNKLLNNNSIAWGKQNQICINTTVDEPNNYHLGAGSLWYDWSNANNTDDKISVPIRQNPLNEEDFTQVCTSFVGTGFETALNEISKYYKVGRVRLMRSKPKTCLTWHEDNTIRVHYPIKTQEGCFMAIGDEIKFLPKYTWWETNTLPKHTALNASFEDRIHLVVTVIEKYNSKPTIALTGHTSGVGAELAKYFEVDGFSRSNGYDIKDVDKIVDAVKDYSVFINNACDENFQYLLCSKLWSLWKTDPNKKIINIGSRAKDFIKSTYGVNKNLLSTFTAHCNFNGACKVSCINPGYIKNDKLLASDVAEIIKLIIEKNYTIEEVTLFKESNND